MMRHRPCGCDARDNIEYDQGAAPSSQLCSACDPTPCAYVAQFGCIIEHNGICLAGESGGFEGAVEGDVWAAGDVTLRVLCEFENPCVFVSLQDATGIGVTCSPTTSCHQDICCTGTQEVIHNGQPCVGCTNPGACQWVHRLGSIEGLVTGWEMDISADPVQLTHTAAGVTYEADAAWDCLGKNTMTLTAPFDGPLPRKVCVIPKPFRDGDGLALPFTCSNEGLIEQNCCDDAIPCGYSDEDRMACGDPCCTCLPEQTVTVTCGECSQTNTVLPCVGEGNDIQGVDNPAGPTYGASATFCGYDVDLNFYCRGLNVGWAVDIYFDNVFCDTIDMAEVPEKCPLNIGIAPGATCGDCSICVGPDCTPPCDPNDCDAYPETLTATFSGSTCFNGTVTMTSTSATEWGGDSLVGGRWSIGLICNGDGTFTLTAIDGNSPPECFVNNFTSTSAECDPAAISFGSQTIGDLGGCTCVGDSVTVSITA